MAKSTLNLRLVPETVRSIAAGSISGTYAGIGTAISNPCRIFLLQNLTDASLMFSFDGIHDHMPLPASGYMLLDIASNKSITEGFFLAQGQRIYVKTLGSPSSGSVYLTVFYAQG